MSKFSDFCAHLNNYFLTKKATINFQATLHDTSYDTANKHYVFNFSQYNNNPVISFDAIGQSGYALTKPCRIRTSPKTVDAFLIDNNNVWYFIEFKNSKLTKCENDIELKALHNLLVLIDIMKLSGNNPNVNFNNSDPMQFIRSNCVFIAVIDSNKDPVTKNHVKNQFLVNKHYCPSPILKLKELYFKDAYIYTEYYLANVFMKNFVY